MRKFYLTTAIAYTSAVPHIGNVYEAIKMVAKRLGITKQELYKEYCEKKNN